jgi:hypothetical protein
LLRSSVGYSDGFLIVKAVFACVFTDLRSIADAVHFAFSDSRCVAQKLRAFSAEIRQTVEMTVKKTRLRARARGMLRTTSGCLSKCDVQGCERNKPIVVELIHQHNPLFSKHAAKRARCAEKDCLSWPGF